MRHNLFWIAKDRQPRIRPVVFYAVIVVLVATALAVLSDPLSNIGLSIF